MILKFHRPHLFTFPFLLVVYRCFAQVGIKNNLPLISSLITKQTRKTMALRFFGLWLILLYSILTLVAQTNNSEIDSLASTKDDVTKLSTATVGSEQYFVAYQELLYNYINKRPNINLDSLASELINTAIEYKRPSYHAYGLYVKAQLANEIQDYTEALTLFNQALKISKQGKIHHIQGKIISHIGLTKAYATREYQQGFEQLLESIEFCKKHKLEEQLSKNYYILGYLNRACYESKEGQLDLQKSKQYQSYLSQAEYYLTQATIVAQSINDQEQVNRVLSEKMRLYMNLKKYDEATGVGLKLLQSSLIQRDDGILRMITMNLAHCYYALQNTPLAKRYLDKVIELDEKRSDTQDLRVAYYTKKEWALAEEDYKEAYFFYQKEQELVDSIWTRDKKIAFDELIVTHETEKKEKENIILTKEKKFLETKNKWISLSAILFLLGLGTISFFFIKNRKQSRLIILQKEELEKMDELKSHFFANVSHELRTPLTLILGPINAALKRNKLDAQDFAYLKMARRNGNQLLLLVHSILDLSKLEVNKLSLEESAIDFYPLMRRLVAAFESNAEIQGIHLTFNYPPNTELPIQLDVPKFEIIMNNLLSNALKFTPKGGKIAVQVQAHPKQIDIQVADTGKGIAAEDLPFIFDRYYQTKKSNQPLEGGTGIGLALCKEYAQLFKGTITVKSVVGKGSTFTFVFPKKEAIAVTIPFEAALPPLIENSPIEILPAPITNGQKDKAHLLIVEDNKDMRLYIQSILGDIFQCHTAENGQLAWDYLNDAATIQPDLIISDLMMPFMDGFELLEKIKADDKWRTTPVIMLTARSAKADRLKALTIGIDDYLTKPFDTEELVARVNNLLQNHLARKLQRQAELPAAKDVSPEAMQFKPVTAADIEWIQKVNEQIKADIGKFDLNLLNIAHKMSISERQLRRRILDITGMKAGAYLKEIRLQQARHFLELKAYLSVAEVGYAVGFNTPNYFAKIYKARFGKLPKTYF